MKLKHIQKAAQSLFKIRGTQELNWLGNKLWIGDQEYALPMIQLEGNTTRTLSSARDPQEILEAMRGYAKKVIEHDPKELEQYPGYYLHTQAFFTVVNLPFYRIWDRGRERTQDYEEYGFPVLVEIIEHIVDERAALIRSIFEAHRAQLSKKENVTDQLMQLIRTTTIWKEEIIPALKKNKFVRGHIAMEEAMEGANDKRLDPTSRLSARDFKEAEMVLQELQREARDVRK